MTIFSLVYTMFVALWSTVAAFMPVCFNISVEPAVFECGTEYYSVVWVTSGKSSGYVKYTYDNIDDTILDKTISA